jgi:hypothetical protein
LIYKHVWYAQWMGIGLQNQCSQFDSDTRLFNIIKVPGNLSS